MAKHAINLFKGHPSDNLLPVEPVNQAVNSLLTRKRPQDDDPLDRHPLTYGTDPGSVTVRNSIAQWTAELLGEEPADSDCINLTNGASYGAALALITCTHAQSGYTKQAFILSPTYFLINTVFLDAGFAGKLTAVKEDKNGIDLTFLEAELDKWNQEPNVSISKVMDNVGDRSYTRKFYRYVIYLVPTFSNPRGGVVPLSQRKQLLHLARKHDALILCDDVYDMLDYRDIKNEGPLPSRLVVLDRQNDKQLANTGNVISNCTFSKLVGPGIRVGWQECSSAVLAKQLCSAGSVMSGGTPAQMNSMVIGEMIRSGSLNKVIDNLKKVYSERAKVTKWALQNYLPDGTVIEGGKGGYFYWVTLPDGFDARKIAEICKERQVLLAGGDEFEVVDNGLNWGAHCFRVSFSYEEINTLIEGIKVWGMVCKQEA